MNLFKPFPHLELVTHHSPPRIPLLRIYHVPNAHICLCRHLCTDCWCRCHFLYPRAAVHHYLITLIIRHALDPETGHKLAVNVLESGLGPRDMLSDDERLKREVKPSVPRSGNGLTHRTCSSGAKTLSNPIGLVAGFDKDGRAIDRQIACPKPPCTHSVQGCSTSDSVGWR